MNHEMPDTRASLDTRCINTIRALCMDAIQAANSGHPGAPLGLAPAAYVLWTRFLRHNPEDPQWPDRDRFVLSGGHASSLLYSLLFLTGYDLDLDDIRQFRQWGSRTPGHPEYGVTPGVETTTGPLGQGLANAVGMAMAERHLAARFNRPDHSIVDHHTYVMCGDGDLMEGISYEAVSLAGHLGLSRLICIYDDNGISIEGSTDITFTEDVSARFAACNWHVREVTDGNDLDAITAALEAARDETERPSLIILRTQIGYGSPNKQGSADAHGAPLGIDEVRLTKGFLGCDETDFCTPDDAVDQIRGAIPRGRALQAEWRARFDGWAAAHPDLAADWEVAMASQLTDGWDAEIPGFTEGDPIATRAASGKVLNALAARIPELMGGSADLAPSNKTFIDGSPEFQKGAYGGRNIRFGVREHAMAAILSGMTLHRGCRPYGGTFLVFADYMRPAIRLAALMKLPVIYVFTHDSLAVGEDGPTHQPVEQIASLRMLAGLAVIRPADAAETAEAWRVAVTRTDGPTALILSRQKLAILDRTTALAPASGLRKGAYVLKDADGAPEIVLIATGAEVHLALSAAEQLAAEGTAVRVVSMPSWELFAAADPAHRDGVIPPDRTPLLVIEAGHPIGWYRYLGGRGDVIGVTGFGASAPGPVVLDRYGFNVENVVARARALLGR